MTHKNAQIAQSTAGRDKGEYFFVLEKDEKSVLLADGKHRTLERPKRKNIRHVRFLPDSGTAAVTPEADGCITNAGLRRAMAAYKAESEKRSMGGT